MKKRKKKNSGKLIILLSFILMIIICGYTVLNSDLFKSSNIKIEGNKRISSKEIIKMLDIKKDKNIFMYNTKEMEKSLMNNNYIESVKIKRTIPNKLQILIIEREIVAILKDKENYYYLDSKGNIVKKIEEIDSSENIINVKSNYNLIEDKRVEFKNEDAKKRLLYLLECIRENNLYKKINKINLEKDGIINMYTSNDLEIILKDDEKIEHNISMLSSILSDLQGKSTNGGTIDFTYGKNAIYRP